jgi:hypothetical protein
MNGKKIIQVICAPNKDFFLEKSNLIVKFLKIDPETNWKKILKPLLYGENDINNYPRDIIMVLFCEN